MMSPPPFPSKQVVGMEEKRWMWETFERRSPWMLHVGGKGPGGGRHDSELLSQGK